MTSAARDLPATAQELERILHAVQEGVTTPEDARTLAELIRFLLDPAMARMEEYSFVLSDGEMAEMERMANILDIFLRQPIPYQQRV